MVVLIHGSTNLIFHCSDLQFLHFPPHAILPHLVERYYRSVRGSKILLPHVLRYYRTSWSGTTAVGAAVNFYYRITYGTTARSTTAMFCPTNSHFYAVPWFALAFAMTFFSILLCLRCVT